MEHVSGREFFLIFHIRKGQGLADIPLLVFVQCIDSVLFSLQRSQHVCNADWKTSLHGRTIPHYDFVQQNEKKRDESHSGPPVIL